MICGTLGRRWMQNVNERRWTMKSIRTLTLLIAPAVLASCATPSLDGCAGWRAIRVADASVDDLAANDPETLKALIGHHETGTARGCWQ